jgi:hypothetical protein
MFSLTPEKLEEFRKMAETYQGNSDPQVASNPAPKVASNPASKVASNPAPKVASKPAPKVASKPAPKVAAGQNLGAYGFMGFTPKQLEELKAQYGKL